MTNNTHVYKQPSVLHTDQQRLRRVGVEIEFGSLGLEQVCEQVLDAFGGEVGQATAAEQSIAVPELGEFNVEVDWQLLKKLSSEEQIPSEIMAALSQAATVVVPVEIVCPPLPIDKIQVLDVLIDKLRKAGAEGTESSFLSAFGVHINTEIPNLEATTLDNYLRAFVLLQSWLVRENKVDLSRRITPYIDLYPDQYLERVLRREQPDMDTLMDDYLEFNATRNRALDLLPLLSEINSERVEKDIDDSRIKARPTFHYRLPDCRISDAQWNLAEPWNLWCVVESLAADVESLKALTEAALQENSGAIALTQSSWLERIDQWLKKSA